MARNKKFGQLGVNDSYSYGDEDVNGTSHDENTEEEQGLSGEKNGSEKFTYTKTKRVARNRKSGGSDGIPDVPYAPIILALCCLCLSLAGAFILNADFVYALSQNMQSGIKTAVSVCVYVIPAIVYLLLRKNSTLYNFRGCNMGYFPLIFVSLGLVLCVSALQKYLIAYIFSYRVPMGSAQGSLLTAILVGALVPAVCEEFLVRGVLQYEFSKYSGGFGGVLFSALVFTMLHFDLQFFGVYFVAGIVLGTLTHVTKSVFPAMLVHFLNNTFSITLSDRLTFVALERIGGTLLIIVLAAACFVLLAVMLQMMEKISTKRAVHYLKGDDSDEDKKGVEEMYKGKAEEEVILFTAHDGSTAARIAKLFVNRLSVVCYVIFLAVVFIAL